MNNVNESIRARLLLYKRMKSLFSIWKTGRLDLLPPRRVNFMLSDKIDVHNYVILEPLFECGNNITSIVDFINMYIRGPRETL